MRPGWIPLLCALALLSAGCGGEDGEEVGGGEGVVFTVFENLPPEGACPGLYFVDGQSREITWLRGYDTDKEDFALWPGFTSSGLLAHAVIVDPSSQVPLADLYVGEQRVARPYFFAPWAWSPTRDEVAYPRLSADGKRVELVVQPLEGEGRVVAPTPALGLAWFPDGDRLVYGHRRGDEDAISVVDRTGSGRRVLADRADSPLPSPDGRRVAFLRPVGEPGSLEVELWLIAAVGGDERRLLPAAFRDELRPMLWLSNRELLVQRGEEEDVMFDAGDQLHVVDVETGEERPFLERAFALSLSPAGDRLLFARKHTAAGEGYYSLRTVDLEGRDERVLAVADEEDFNVRSIPVWRPADAPLEPIGPELPNAPAASECVERLTSLRDRSR